MHKLNIFVGHINAAFNSNPCLYCSEKIRGYTGCVRNLKLNGKTHFIKFTAENSKDVIDRCSLSCQSPNKCKKGFSKCKNFHGEKEQKCSCFFNDLFGGPDCQKKQGKGYYLIMNGFYIHVFQTLNLLSLPLLEVMH